MMTYNPRSITAILPARPSGNFQRLQWISIAALVIVLALIWLLTWQRLQAEEALLEKNAELQQR
ncbi:MAG: hypothetical protein ACYCXC_06820, partial [Acidovorax defluvii]